MTLRWMTAFLDYPEDVHKEGIAFWSTVTGYSRSPGRGEHGQFSSLLPPAGTDYLRVQRVGGSAPRIHLDLHVDDPAAAVADAQRLGATAVATLHDDVTVLRSPGGFVFCFVPGTTGRRPEPTTRPDGHSAYVDQVCLDIPPSRYDDEMSFWDAVTSWRRKDPEPGSEFGRLTPGSDQPLQLLMQRLDDEQDAVTAHLDWSSTDHEAEVAAHEAAGAEVQGRFEGWTVLRDPAGMTYCVTRRKAGDRPE